MARYSPVVAASMSVAAAVSTVSVPALAEGVALDLLLSSASPSQNTMEITVGAEVRNVPVFGTVSDSDSDASTLSGNALADLDIDFLADGNVAAINSLSFAGGRMQFDDDLTFNLSLALGLATIDATGMDLAGTLQTLGAGSPVNGSGGFDLAFHQILINEGMLDAVGGGAASSVSQSFDFGLSPLAAPLVGSADLDVVLAGITGNTATYNVTLTAPVSFTQTLDIDADTTVTVSATGNLIATDIFSRLLGVQGDIDFDGDVDIDDLGILAGNWQQSISGVGNGDIDEDGDVDIDDLGLLAGNWQFGVDEGGLPNFDEAVASAGIAIPEPGSLALLALSTLALTRRQRR